MAGNFEEEDDFDFGGDVLSGGFETKGTKRPLNEEDAELYPAKKPTYGGGLAAVGDEHATTTILNLRASLDEKDAAIASVKAKLDAANAELERWRSSFRDSSALAGLGSRPDPTLAMQAVLKLQTAESKLREQLQGAKRQENSMLVKLSTKEQEMQELKMEVQELRTMLQPTLTQARKLLLDPILHLEFTRMKGELEAAEKKLKEAQDDLAAVQFTPHSKNGKMLMAKCKTLQEENDELGRQASEGKMHELENKLALQKQLNTELKLGYKELQEYVDDINEEAERLQYMVYTLQQQLQQKERERLHPRQDGGTRGARSAKGGDESAALSKRDIVVKEEGRHLAENCDKRRPSQKEEDRRT